MLAVRSISKGEAAAQKLRIAAPGASIEVWALDMDSYASIQGFAHQCTSLDRIDFAMLNAGTSSLEFSLNKSTGHENIFQVNYLSTALLTLVLLPVLRAKHAPGKPAHLSMTGSGLALTAKFANQNARPLIPSFDDPTGWNLSAAADRYSTSSCYWNYSSPS